MAGWGGGGGGVDLNDLRKRKSRRQQESWPQENKSHSHNSGTIFPALDMKTTQLNQKPISVIVPHLTFHRLAVL